eukprot:TRINITY_DN6476_c0_g2_i2.p3 TRINITY_DN6476_c0_g2~~TRINITY_DN6476_c0_g2_i2.p3  ORF type:complete len:185 (+),score=-3.76 TRINITY_DN6476_c0_g2_i2:199-753(+)
MLLKTMLHNVIGLMIRPFKQLDKERIYMPMHLHHPPPVSLHQWQWVRSMMKSKIMTITIPDFPWKQVTLHKLYGVIPRRLDALYIFAPSMHRTDNAYHQYLQTYLEIGCLQFAGIVHPETSGDSLPKKYLLSADSHSTQYVTNQVLRISTLFYSRQNISITLDRMKFQLQYSNIFIAKLILLVV